MKELSKKNNKDVTVLVVVYVRVLRILWKKTLKEMGYKVVACSVGLKGIERFKTGKYDLVLIDSLLPDMSGLDVSRRLREICKKKVPIVLIKRSGINVDIKERETCNAYYIIRIPFYIDRILEVVQQTIGKNSC